MDQKLSIQIQAIPQLRHQSWPIQLDISIHRCLLLPAKSNPHLPQISQRLSLHSQDGRFPAQTETIWKVLASDGKKPNKLSQAVELQQLPPYMHSRGMEPPSRNAPKGLPSQLFNNSRAFSVHFNELSAKRIGKHLYRIGGTERKRIRLLVV